jgi:hypothetical protein
MAFDANGNWVPDTPSSFDWFNPSGTYGTSMNPNMGVSWNMMQNMYPAQGAMSNYIPMSQDEFNRRLAQAAEMQRTPYTGPGSSFIGDGKFFANGGDALRGVGAVLGGVGSLSQAWTAMKGLDFAKQAAATQEAQWNKNYEAQRTATNNAIANQNAWKLASGRSDTSAYVGDWSNAANLQPTAKV